MPVANTSKSAATDHRSHPDRAFGLEMLRGAARPTVPPVRIVVGAGLPKLALAVFALAFELEGLPCALAVVVRGRDRVALAVAIAGRGEVVDVEPPALAVTAFGR